jgi:hypothetical protein
MEPPLKFADGPRAPFTDDHVFMRGAGAGRPIFDGISPEAGARLAQISADAREGLRRRGLMVVEQTIAGYLWGRWAEAALARTGTIPQQRLSLRQRIMVGTGLPNWWWVHPKVIPAREYTGPQPPQHASGDAYRRVHLPRAAFAMGAR